MNDSERYNRLYSLYMSAKSLAPEHRDSFLEKECAADPDLLAELRRFLGTAKRTETILPAVDLGSANDSAAKPLPPGDLESQLPERIGPYRIVDTLGSGGMGVVYLAEQELPVRRKVALKVVKVGMDTKEVVSRFEAERQALALMNHENIAKVFDAGSTPEGRPYFAMEHVPGIPLTDYCDERRLSTRERLELFTSVCEAVQHAHQKGIIHRDLKPSNILVMDQGERRIPKVIDFGVAKAINQRLTEHTLFTRLGLFVGTPEYMSPEQADLRAEDVDTRTDIYSLGVVFYELLIGALPFDSETLRAGGMQEIQRVIREEEPQRPSTRLAQQRDLGTRAAERRRTDLRVLERELRRDLDWIAMKSLEKDRMRRYASASELGADVRRYLNDEPVLAGPPSGLYRLRKLLRKHRRSAAAAVVIVGVLALLPLHGVYSSWRHLTDRIREAEERLDAGLESVEAYRSERASVDALFSSWREAEKEAEPWQPVWERRKAIKAQKDLLRTQSEVNRLHSEALAAFLEALARAPDASEVQQRAHRAIEDAYWERYGEALVAGSITQEPDFFASMAKSIGLDPRSQRIRSPQVIQFFSRPPGARVHCFRYETRDERLLPLPFDPRSDSGNPVERIRGDAYLEVERVWDDGETLFQPGDRLVAINGVPVRTLEELARNLEPLQKGAAVTCRVRRAGGDLELAWVPFPDRPFVPRTFYEDGEAAEKKSEYRPGRVIDTLAQWGITFSAYPLEFLTACEADPTRDGRPVEITLPPGSYLFVLSKDGYADARVPIVVPRDDPRIVVRLVARDLVPKGFVYVPAGKFLAGGDREAFQSLEGKEAAVGDFFIQRHEVTSGEYLEFLRARDVPDSGEAEPRTDEVRRLLELRGWSKVQLKPEFSWWEKEVSGEWKCDERRMAAPVSRISYFAAVEYAAWKTEASGRRWKFRLPTDLQWERSARGADRRIHVWGDLLVWTFCLCANGFPPAVMRFPKAPGMVPYDESPFDVRDLAGSMAEWTSDRSHWRHEYRAVRGGHYNTTDDYEFRAATRNGLRPDLSRNYVGFRLVAEFPE